MVLAMSRIEAIVSSTVRAAAVIVTRLVTSRIFLVSLRLLETLWIDGSMVDWVEAFSPPVVGGVSELRTASTLLGLSGMTWKVSGSGFDPSSR